MPVRAKTRITIMLDDDVIEHFRGLGQREGVGYQTKINASLREVIAQSGERNRKRDTPVTASDLKKVLRKVLREELRKSK
jgi:hypothetical protein